MSAWAALAWGVGTSSSLFIGQALAGPMEPRRRATGLVMGFGAGTLLSAVAYDLLPEAVLDRGVTVAVALVLGALTYFVGDWVVDRNGGANRQQIAGADESGSGAAMFIGALLDGVPEAFILGITLALGGSISVAFVTAVFVSNIPQGVAGTTSLESVGYRGARIARMWGALTIVCGIAAALGFAVADQVPSQGVAASGFAAGAVLVMLSDAMIPEALEHGGRAVGLATVFGYLVAAILTVLQ